MRTVSQLEGAKPVKPQWLRAYELTPVSIRESLHGIVEALARLVQSVSGPN